MVHNAMGSAGFAALLGLLLCGLCPSTAQQTVGYVRKLEGQLKPLMAQRGPDPAALEVLRGALARATEATQALKDGLDTLDRQSVSVQGGFVVGGGSGIGEILEDAEKEYEVRMKVREPWIKSYNRTKILPRLVTEILLIPTYPCALESRLGDWRDGGKWVCIKHLNVQPKPVALSIGSKGEKSFEEEFSTRRGGFSHVFDPSLKQDVQEKMSSYPYLKFYNLGLSGQDDLEQLKARYPQWDVVTIEKVIKATGVKYFDIFKIDCEGCEVGVSDDMVKLYTRDTVPFGQIQMELHHADKKIGFFRLLTNLESLGFRLFHTEMNPFFKDHYEVAYIHEKLVKPSGTNVG